MTLFEDAARGFRQAFFQRVKVHTVVNFSNLAEVLAGGRFRVPAAAFFYKRRDDGTEGLDEDEFVRTYSPLVANQEPTRPVRSGRATSRGVSSSTPARSATSPPHRSPTATDCPGNWPPGVPRSTSDC